MERLADDFGDNVVRSHWQWQAYDEKDLIILVNYNSAGQEISRRPITMSKVGWPRVEPSSRGCSEVLRMVLGVSQDVDDFKVKSKFFDGIKLNGKILDTCCEFSTPTSDKKNPKMNSMMKQAQKNYIGSYIKGKLGGVSVSNKSYKKYYKGIV